MSWEYEMAKRLKEETGKARSDAVEEASFFIGIIEKLSPLTVSAAGGELMYEEGTDLVVSQRIADYSQDVNFFRSDGVVVAAKRESLLHPGVQVLLAPVDDCGTMAIIDTIKE